MKIKKGFVLSTVGGECVAVATGKLAGSVNSIIKLNSTAEFLFKFFLKEHTYKEGVSALIKEYKISEEVAEENLSRFIDVLKGEGVFE